MPGAPCWEAGHSPALRTTRPPRGFHSANGQGSRSSGRGAGLGDRPSLSTVSHKRGRMSSLWAAGGLGGGRRPPRFSSLVLSHGGAAVSVHLESRAEGSETPAPGTPHRLPLGPCPLMPRGLRTALPGQGGAPPSHTLKAPSLTPRQAHTRVAGLVPSRGWCERRPIDTSLSLPSPLPSLLSKVNQHVLR